MAVEDVEAVEITVEKEDEREEGRRLYRWSSENYRERYTVRFGAHPIDTVVAGHGRKPTDKWFQEVEHHRSRRRKPFLVSLCCFRGRRCRSFGDKPKGLEASSSYPGHPISLLALCLGGAHCLLLKRDYDYRGAPPGALVGFLRDGCFKCVGIDVTRDAEKLLSEWGMEVGSPQELRSLVEQAFGKEAAEGHQGLEDMAELVLGVKVGKKPAKVADGDWGYSWPTAKQVKYATVDAYLAFEIGLKCCEKLGIDI